MRGPWAEAARLCVGQAVAGGGLATGVWAFTGSLAGLLPIGVLVGLVTGWLWAVRRPGRQVDRATLRAVSGRVALAWGAVAGLVWAASADDGTPGGLVRAGLAVVMGAVGGGAVGGLTACGIDAGRKDR